MPEGGGISKEDAKKIAEELSKLSKSSVSGTSAFPTQNISAFSSALDAATGKANPLGAALDIAKGAANKAADGLSYIKQAAETGLGAFRELSKTGASFSNDIIGMTVASKGMRLELDEFVDVMKNNSASFIGLGGSVTRGAEAFAKLSSEFMDSPYIDSLKQAGYTNKELNEVLALQMSMQRYTAKEDDASRKASIESAAELAKEMDLQAKLTGKSREEQMANMKKQKEDMQIEAKMRQIGIEKGPEAEAAARKAFAQQMNEAQLRGTEQLFKESILYGNAVSKEAAMQSITAGQGAFQAQIEAGRAFSKGEFEKSAEFSAKTQAEIISFQRTSASNQIAMLPVQNELTSSSHKLMKANQGYYDALAKVQQSEEFKNKTTEEQVAEAKRLAAEAAAGKNKEGQEVSGATKAMINFGSRVEDAQAAIFKNLVEPLNQKIGPALGQFADKTLSRAVIVPGQANTTYQQAVGKEIQRGMEGVPEAEKSGKGAYYDRFVGGKDRAQSPILGGDAMRDAAKVVNTGADTLLKGIESFNAAQAKPKHSMYGGTPGLFNQVVHDFGVESEALLHGKKAVLNEDQLLNMSKGISQATLSESFKNFKNVSISGKGPDTNLQNMMSQLPDNMKSVIAAQGATTTSGATSSSAAASAMAKMKETKSTLDDVVTSLNNLNNKMERLLDINEDLGTKQIKATKSNNSNIYARA